ncbi:phosphatidate cytidylyltransferase [Streptomyces sp. NPDC093598]|uniref:phosphatidate cytidylyltransferase n=1 Tax=Streptomyces sp. NPDC093598 TaxID=3366046 RepID=UPI003807BF5D
MTSVAALAPWLGGALLVSGVAVGASRRRELMVRWCAWAVGVPVVTAAFWWGRPGIALLAVIVAVVAVLEFGAMTQLPRTDRAVLAAAVTGLIVAAASAPDQIWRVGAVGALTLVAVTVAAGDAEDGLRRLGTGVLGLVWLGVLAALAPLGTLGLALFTAVSIADVVAYFAGQRLGGPRLSRLSPAKRWSGTLCGAAAGLAVLASLSAWSWPAAAAVAVGGPAGDLVESLIKRGAGVKDSGRWLAGAGGLLDRIDSLVGALAVLVVLG